jgi:polysaccharide biosynthesis protein PslH
MKLLWITPYLPFPPDHGGKVRAFNLISRIASKHEVHLLAIMQSSERGKLYEPLTRCCASVTLVQWATPTGVLERISKILSPTPRIVSSVTTSEGERRLEHLLTRHAFDVAILEQVNVAGYLDILRRAGVPGFLVCQSVESRLWRVFARHRSRLRTRLLSRLEAIKLARYEPWALRASTYRVAVSEHDRSELERVGGVSCGLSPNGVDLEYFTPRAPRQRSYEQPWRLVMTGSMGYPPNIDAVEFFIDDILPLLRPLHPRVKVDFVGSAPAPQLLARQVSEEAIHFTGYVEDVRPYVAASDIFIVPLRQGSGTRLKVLEAMAQGIPVVSTPKGCEGLDVTHGEHIWVADTPEMFLKGVEVLMRDSGFAATMAANARALVEQKYSWERIADPLEADLCNTPRKATCS